MTLPENLVDQLGLEFDRQERDLAALSLREDRAELTESEPDSAEASVRNFKTRFWVWVRRRNGKLEHGCDCPYFEETGKGCEHLFALRLLLEPEEVREEEIEDEDSLAIELRWRILPSSSLRKNRLFLDLRDAAGKPIALDQEAWIRIENEADITALKLLAEQVGGFREARRGGGLTQTRGPYEIPGEKAGRLLLAAAATGRLEVADEREEIALPVAATPGPMFELMAAIEDGSPARLVGLLVGERGNVEIAAVSALVPGPRPWVVTGSRLHPVAAHGAGAWARTFRKEGSLSLPAERLEAFLGNVAKSQPLPRLMRRGRPLPLIEARPRARLEIRRSARVVTAELVWLYADVELRGAGPGDLALAPGLDRQISRDRRREQELLRLVLDAGFEAATDEADVYGIDARDLPAAIRRLLPTEIELAAQGAPLRTARLGEFRIEGRGDWFALEGRVRSEDGGPPIPLGRLLAAFRSDESLVRLDDGSLIALDDADRRRLEQLAPLAAMAEDSPEGLRFRKERALLADLVLARSPLIDRSALAEARAELTASLQESNSAPGPGFSGTLRPYQAAGLAWLEFVARSGLGGCLADEMGLGKTVQIIAFIDKIRTGGAPPCLIVAPLSLLGNWADEFARFAPGLRIREHHGATRDLERNGDADVILTSYGTMRRDIEVLSARRFDVVVLDEAQAVKNRDSQTAAAARRLDARCRFALSGTPVENRLDDLWSLFEFLAPELFLPGRALDGVRRLGREADPRELMRALRPVLLRRRKEEVLRDLPELLEQTLVCSMTEEQEKLYGRLLESTRSEIEKQPAGDGRPAMMLEALLRLRQAACHPGLLGVEGSASGKIEILLDRLEEARAEGRKALVFSQFRGLLDLVAADLSRRGIQALRLDGRVTDRAAVCRQFQEGSEALPLLISLKVGGTGLNLTAAEEVFILDPWWNPAVEAQAVARAHRIGQSRRVLAMRLVSRGTVEEKILILQAAKRELAEAIVGEAIEGIAALDAEDLRLLLGN